MQTLLDWGPGLAVGLLTGLVAAALLPSGRDRTVPVQVDDDLRRERRPSEPRGGT